MDELTREFLIESHEAVDALDNDLLVLDEAPADKPTIDSVFRSLHTIKGVASCLGFETTESVTHAAETLLMLVRDGERTLSTEGLAALFETIDALRVALEAIEATNSDASVEVGALVGRLEALAASDEGDTSAESPAPAAQPSTPEAAPAAEPETEAEAAAPAAASEPPPVTTSSTSPSAKPIGRQDNGLELFEPLSAANMDDDLDVDAPAAAEPRMRTTQVVPVSSQELAADRRESMTGPNRAAVAPDASPSTSAAPPAQPEAAAATPPAPTSAPAKHTAPASATSVAKVGDSTIRVPVDLLEAIMNQVGELVLCRNEIVQTTCGADRDFVAAAQRLNLITAELQESVMKTRMQPIGAVWNKLPRAVRDIALACGKSVRVVMEGAETELDKTLIEAIKDPLTHLVRNAVDHGIESPGERAMRGKPEEGTLRLRAFQEDGQVAIAISDDGKGIDPERVRRKAIQSGVISAEEASALTREQTLQLIFHPGLSTAEEVTHVSGRGVGMDVVRTNIEDINGTIDIQSEAGEGTTVLLRIPLTLAIIPGLIVTCDDNRYVIPQNGLLELVRLEGQRDSEVLEFVHDVPVYRLRGKLLPLIFLAESLGLRSYDRASLEAQQVLNICVVQAKGRQYGLVVDDVIDTQEIVVKPIAKMLKATRAYAGATILGDGCVSLILDVVGVAEAARLMETDLESESGSLDKVAQSDEQDWLLVVTTAAHARLAIPLSRVARLEEFSVEDVEWTGDSAVTQYRGSILRLLDVATLLSGSRVAPPLLARVEGGAPIHAVVVVHGDKTIGVVVEDILDIVQQSATLERAGAREGVQGTMILQELVTELLDVDALLRRHEPTFFTDSFAVAC